MKNINNIPLRERKYAQTKLNILHEVIEELKTQRFDSIAIKELCKRMLISEGTFYNYFPRKDDVLVYYIQLWTIEVIWHVNNKIGNSSGIKSIEEIFEFTAAKAKQFPRIIEEIIAFQALSETNLKFSEITLAERLIAFPNFEGIDKIPDTPWDSLFSPYLDLAIKLNELPKTIDKTLVMSAIIAILNGIPVLIHQAKIKNLGTAYKKQLSLLWAGINAYYS